ncbi:unnamed protein product [Microthlaspi erraticum]|uniref:Uncharacterized protein n=1 Tax=Microthlaspi erraticum TaxID=1685480 RepID=A0A6D2ILB3_9BRAS|nr:unnamed protein product [Microthlaspi erraticum]
MSDKPDEPRRSQRLAALQQKQQNEALPIRAKSPEQPVRAKSPEQPEENSVDNEETNPRFWLMKSNRGIAASMREGKPRKTLSMQELVTRPESAVKRRKINDSTDSEDEI